MDINDRANTSRFNAFHSYKDIASDKETLNGSIEYLFTDRFANLLDEVIVTNNKDLLSKEQMKMIDTYFSEADTGALSNKSEQLDKFLGER